MQVCFFPGMSTRKFYFQTTHFQEHSTEEETTIGIYPTKSDAEGI